MDELDKEVLSFMDDLWKSLGISDVFHKVISVLYLEPEEISMEELAKKTGYSLASISNSMKILTNSGMVKRIRKPRTKKVFFYMEKDVIEANKKKVRFILENTFQPIENFLPRIIEKYKDKAKDERAKKKLLIIKNYHHQIIQLEGVLKKMLRELDKISVKNKNV